MLVVWSKEEGPNKGVWVDIKFGLFTFAFTTSWFYEGWTSIISG